MFYCAMNKIVNNYHHDPSRAYRTVLFHRKFASKWHSVCVHNATTVVHICTRYFYRFAVLMMYSRFVDIHPLMTTDD